jgi:hypothetical protein
VAQAVEAGEVPAALLGELQAEVEAARERPQEKAHAEAVAELAGILGVPLEQIEDGIKTVKALPRVTRKLLLPRVVEARLDAQRRHNRPRLHGG